MEDLQQLYRQCRPDIYRYLLLLTRSPAAAEDLTQEVFLTALQKLPAFREASTPRTWLIGIARNHYRSWRRAQKLHLPLEDAPLQAPAFGPGYEDWQLVLERMNALPETPGRWCGCGPRVFPTPRSARWWARAKPPPGCCFSGPNKC